jgi:hypothetical protein
MDPRLEEARFGFQEELALKNSLYSIAETVLKYAIHWSGASAGVFLYAAPGASQFEKVVELGINKDEMGDASYFERNGNHPIALAIRVQKDLEIKVDEAVSLVAFPLSDSGMTSAGYFISFLPARNIDQDTKNILFWLAHQAEVALFNKDSEGV